MERREPIFVEFDLTHYTHRYISNKGCPRKLFTFKLKCYWRFWVKKLSLNVFGMLKCIVKITKIELACQDE